MPAASDAVVRGSGPPDRAPEGVQVPAGGGGESPLRAGADHPRGGVERAVGEVPRHGLRGHPWAVPRPYRAVPDRWRGAGHQLPLHGRLCR